MSDEKSMILDQNRKGVRGQFPEREGNHVALPSRTAMSDRLNGDCYHIEQPHSWTNICGVQRKHTSFFFHWVPFSPNKLYLRRVSWGLISLIPHSFYIHFLFPRDLTFFWIAPNPLKFSGGFLWVSEEYGCSSLRFSRAEQPQGKKAFLLLILTPFIT